jgi:hypothetical protein
MCASPLPPALPSHSAPGLTTPTPLLAPTLGCCASASSKDTSCSSKGRVRTSPTGPAAAAAAAITAPITERRPQGEGSTGCGSPTSATASREGAGSRWLAGVTAPAGGGGGGGWGAWAAGAAWVRQATRTATGKSTSHCLLPMAAARQAGPWLSSAWQCAEPRLIAWPPPRAAGCCRCPAAPPPPPPRLPLPRAAGARGWWQGAAAAGQKGQRLRARAARPGQRPAARPVQRPSKGVGVLLLAGAASRRGELQIGLDAEDC